jgi:DNA-binding transcriptional LysR family regulator
MDYRHLRFFIAVAEELSFTRAAARLRVAQPHLSREIRHLEGELGVPLFVRDRRRVTLSAAGSTFLEQAHRILAHSAEAVRLAQLAHRGEIGRVRVGFSSSAAFGLLPDVVRRFRRERPDVELVLTECNSDEQPDMLRNVALDVSLLYPPSRPEQGLESYTLVVDPLVAALPADHPLTWHRTVALAALANEPWIFFRRAVASRLHDEILRACGAAGFMPQVVQEALKLSTIANLVATGLGVSLVPITLTRLRLRHMVCRPLEEPIPQVPLAIMWRHNDPNPALTPFMDTVRDEARRFISEGGWASKADVPEEVRFA